MAALTALVDYILLSTHDARGLQISLAAGVALRADQQHTKHNVIAAYIPEIILKTRSTVCVATDAGTHAARVHAGVS